MELIYLVILILEMYLTIAKDKPVLKFIAILITCPR